MSNIEPRQIAILVARAWGVTLADMAAPAHGPSRRMKPYDTPGFAARACAAMLIRKHTQASAGATTLAVGMAANREPERLHRLIDRFKRHVVRNPSLVYRIEAIEREIDAVHDKNSSVSNELTFLAKSSLENTRVNC